MGALLAHFGNAVQAVGAAWQLTVTGQPADLVALVQSATNLPIMLLALPAGAMADMLDRRTLMLVAQGAMFSLSLLLALLSFAGVVPPALVIGLTALLACGVACFNPALAGSISHIVPRAELGAAIALNILAFSVARTVGPALGGAIVAVGGAKAAFAANAMSYLAVIAILWRWRQQAPKPEGGRRITSVIAEGFRFAASSAPVRTIMLRAITFTATGSAAWALMPLVSSEMLGQGSFTFGMLLGALGLGSVAGAASSTWFRQRYNGETITRAAGLIYGAGCLGVSFSPPFWVMLVLLAIGGAAWVQALSGFSVAGQLWAPRPLIGRITAMVSSVTFGGIALGSWLWGHFAEYHGVANALMASGAGMMVLPLLGLILPLPREQPAAQG